MVFLIADQRIRRIAESVLNRLPISDERLSLDRLSQPQIAFQCPASKNRLAHLRTVGPETKLRGHQARKGAASAECSASRSSKRNLREELCLCDSDFGIGRNQILLRLA